jgi:hypothetical protein
MDKSTIVEEAHKSLVLDALSRIALPIIQSDATKGIVPAIAEQAFKYANTCKLKEDADKGITYAITEILFSEYSPSARQIFNDTEKAFRDMGKTLRGNDRSALSWEEGSDYQTLYEERKATGLKGVLNAAILNFHHQLKKEMATKKEYYKEELKEYVLDKNTVAVNTYMVLWSTAGFLKCLKAPLTDDTIIGLLAMAFKTCILTDSSLDRDMVIFHMAKEGAELVKGIMQEIEGK